MNIVNVLGSFISFIIFTNLFILSSISIARRYREINSRGTVYRHQSEIHQQIKDGDLDLSLCVECIVVVVVVGPSSSTTRSSSTDFGRFNSLSVASMFYKKKDSFENVIGN